MTYYWTGTDIDLGDHPDLEPELNHGRGILFIKEEVDPQVSPLEGSQYSDPEMAKATPEEREAWHAAYKVLEDRLTGVDVKLTKALRAWEAAKKEAVQASEEAWQAYKPIHEAIEDRHGDLMELRRAHSEAAENALKEAEDARLRAEDARLGPREFLVTRPRLRGRDGTHGDVPTIHLTDCPSARRMKSVPAPVRLADAFETLMDGGVPYVCTWRWEPEKTEKRLFGEVCNRCAAEAKFLDAYPVAYTEWRRHAENVQPKLPRFGFTSNGRLMDALGLERAIGDSPGYFRSGEYEDRGRHHKSLAVHEGLIGWSDGKYRKADEKRQKELMESLRANGMTGRVWDEDSTFVAFRMMTKAEIREMKEANS